MIEKNKKVKNNIKGITLPSLVIAVIVIIILVRVTIVALTSENGILQKSEETVNNATIAGYKESIQRSAQYLKMNKVYINDDDYEMKLENEMSHYDNIKNAKATKTTIDDKTIVEVVTENGYRYWIEDDSVEYKGEVDEME